MSEPSKAAEREYEVASVDIHGDPASHSTYGDWMSNLTALKPYSFAANGTKIFFAKRQGPFPHDAEYVPMATGEFCSANGGCGDIYVHDLATKKNESVFSHLTVANRHPLSFLTAPLGGPWVGSEDANSFILTWYCYQTLESAPEVIGGTAICEDVDLAADDQEALVLIDLDSSHNEVLAVSHFGGFTFVDISASGDRAIFEWSSYQVHSPGPVKCFRADWDCGRDPSATVLWDRATGDLTAIGAGRHPGVVVNGSTDVGDFSVMWPYPRLSGDGKKVFFVVTSQDWDAISEGREWEETHLFVYDIADESYTEIDLPWERYGHSWGLIGSSYDGSIAYMTIGPLGSAFPDYRPWSVLAQISVTAGTVDVREDIDCGWGTSVSFDGRYVGCNRSDRSVNGVRLSQAVVDTVTGTVHDVFEIASEGFAATNGARGPFVSRDGTKVAALHHRHPDDDDGGRNLDYLFRLYVTDDALSGGSVSVGSPVAGLVDPSQGLWHLYDGSGVQTTQFFFGNPGDFPIVGDWDCDGVETPGMYRQSDGYVYLRNSNTQGAADIRFFFGDPGDVPIAGDFNKDGCDTVSIYRPSSQTFFIINALGANDGGLGAAEFSYVFGDPGDKPFVGDFDGDGVETVGLHRESTGLVYFRNSHTQGNADAQFIFGDPGDRLIAGDWNGNGAYSPALFRPATTTMFFRYTNTQGNADNQFIPAGSQAAWLPVAGVFN